MLLDERVEQGLVGVLKVAHQVVFAERRIAIVQRFFAPLELVLQVSDVGRQQPVKPEGVALLFGERSAFVEARIQKEVVARKMSAHESLVRVLWHRGCSVH